MNWKIWYEDEDGDLHKCWTEASTIEDAIDYVRSEYWNCYEIVDVLPL